MQHTLVWFYDKCESVYYLMKLTTKQTSINHLGYKAKGWTNILTYFDITYMWSVSFQRRSYRYSAHIHACAHTHTNTNTLSLPVRACLSILHTTALYGTTFSSNSCLFLWSLHPLPQLHHSSNVCVTTPPDLQVIRLHVWATLFVCRLPSCNEGALLLH